MPDISSMGLPIVLSKYNENIFLAIHDDTLMIPVGFYPAETNDEQLSMNWCKKCGMPYHYE